MCVCVCDNDIFSLRSLIDAEPAKITDNDIFSLKKEAAEELQENTALLQKRQAKL